MHNLGWATSWYFEEQSLNLIGILDDSVIAILVGVGSNAKVEGGNWWQEASNAYAGATHD